MDEILCFVITHSGNFGDFREPVGYGGRVSQFANCFLEVAWHPHNYDLHTVFGDGFIVGGYDEAS